MSPSKRPKSPKPSMGGAPAKDSKGKIFGEEGTNKTVSQPKPDNVPDDAADPARTGKHIEKTPFLRG